MLDLWNLHPTNSTGELGSYVTCILRTARISTMQDSVTADTATLSL